MRHRLRVFAIAAVALAAALAPTATAATTRSCPAVRNPYPDTRFAGVDLTHITAIGVSCATARTVARRAHAKALGLTPSASGIRTFTWNGWHVRGDLRPASDRYVATKGAAVVRWRF